MSCITVPPAPVNLYVPSETLPDVYNNGTIRVRNLTDTPEDCDFAGKLEIESFRDKVVHATSEGSLKTMISYGGRRMRGKSPLYYQRVFLAEYEGERAGIIVLRYHGDNFPESDDIPAVRCTELCGLWCLWISGLENVPVERCYIDHICVDSKFRGKGIGKVLLDVAEKNAKQTGCRVIYLLVASTNRAQNLYERQGYVIKDSRTGCGCGMWCMSGVRKFYRMDKTL